MFSESSESNRPHLRLNIKQCCKLLPCNQRNIESSSVLCAFFEKCKLMATPGNKKRTTKDKGSHPLTCFIYVKKGEVWKLHNLNGGFESTLKYITWLSILEKKLFFGKQILDLKENIQKYQVAEIISEVTCATSIPSTSNSLCHLSTWKEKLII